MKWNLLLLDDEVCLLDAMAEFFAEDDLEVTTATNGAEGLKLLEERSFDLIVSDVSMPGMDGVEMFKKARELGIFIPHIFFSGHAGPELVEELKDYGGFTLVQKPNFERLSAEINSILTKKEILATRFPFVGESYPVEQSYPF